MKLVEILELVNEMTADVNGEYPFGLIRVRHLVIELIAGKPDENEVVYIGEKPPSPLV